MRHLIMIAQVSDYIKPLYSLLRYLLFILLVLIAEPPSDPEGLSVVAVSAREIMASWSPPAEDSGRTDLYYWVEHSDPDNLGSYINGAFLCGECGNRTFSSLRPFTPYCVRVTAHNGVSDQDPDGTHLRTVEACTVTPEDGEPAISYVQCSGP